jgi:hypothetical protein
MGFAIGHGPTIARRARRRYKCHRLRIMGARIWLKRSAMIEFNRAVPIFRIFSLEKAREFHLDFLGFKVDWEHRFEPDAPAFMQVSRGRACDQPERTS